MVKQKNKKSKIVVLGGGTGNFTVLSGLKKHPVDLTAIVAMADDGGSTGTLRDELGVLPPGDIRQCLVALSESDELMRELMNYRFEKGALKGHNFGNLLLSALEIMTDHDSAVETVSEILRIKGRVLPATLDDVKLVAYLKDGKVVRGEHTIEYQNLDNLEKITLEPKARANPNATKAIREADLIVIAPGDFYQSTVPNLLVSGVARAIREGKAKKVYVCNLMTKAGHTEGYSVKDFTKEVEQFIGGKIDRVIYNNKKPNPALIKKYAEKGEQPVEFEEKLPKNRFVGGDLLSKKFAKPVKGDPLRRNLVRHDSEKLAGIILSLL